MFAMSKFEQMVNSWMAAPNTPIRDIKKMRFAATPLEKRLLQLLRDETCTIAGMATKQAARALDVGIKDLQLPIKHLRMHDLIYSNPTHTQGVSKFWIAY
jgi:hypothetical protein